jgi:hypothetical protein
MITVDIIERADRQLDYFDELKIGQSYNLDTTKITRAMLAHFDQEETDVSKANRRPFGIIQVHRRTFRNPTFHIGEPSTSASRRAGSATRRP